VALLIRFQAKKKKKEWETKHYYALTPHLLISYMNEQVLLEP